MHTVLQTTLVIGALVFSVLGSGLAVVLGCLALTKPNDEYKSQL